MPKDDEDINYCLFCEVLVEEDTDRAWYDHALLRVDGLGAVLPGLGALVPGYVLIFPSEHVESTWLIPHQRSGDFAEFVAGVVAKVESEFGPSTVFEHGSCHRRDKRRSACMDHAHVHVMPGKFALEPSVRSASTIVLPHDTLDHFANDGYLLLREPGQEALVAADPGTSQFFRRGIAASLGVPEQWDYLMYPHYDNVRATIQRLEGRLSW